MPTSGMVFDIQRYSVNDGPGIRTTVFLKGCPLRCPWCHSPESQAPYPQITLKKNDCLGLEACGACKDVCPKNAISFVEDNRPTEGVILIPHIDRTLCDDCGICAEACYTHALAMCGSVMTVDEVMAKVVKDKDFYKNSGGGMTVSGGEPFVQPDFTVDILKAAKREGISTAVDTTGFTSQANLEKALPYTDLFLYDLKSMNSAMHKSVTGVPTETIHDNLNYLARQGAALQVRIPVITNFNDDQDNMERTAEFCASLGDAVHCVQLLPYHTLGLAKYEKLQWNQPIFEAPLESDEVIEQFAEVLRAKGLTVKIH